MRHCTECVIYSSRRFDQTAAYYMGPGAHGIRHGASHKLNPTRLTCGILFVILS